MSRILPRVQATNNRKKTHQKNKTRLDLSSRNPRAQMGLTVCQSRILCNAARCITFYCRTATLKRLFSSFFVFTFVSSFSRTFSMPPPPNFLFLHFSFHLPFTFLRQHLFVFHASQAVDTNSIWYILTTLTFFGPLPGWRWCRLKSCWYQS